MDVEEELRALRKMRNEFNGAMQILSTFLEEATRLRRVTDAQHWEISELRNRLDAYERASAARPKTPCIPFEIALNVGKVNAR